VGNAWRRTQADGIQGDLAAPDVPPMMIVYFFVCFSASSVLEFGSQNVAATLGRLQASRACAYTSIALRAARPHPAQAGLASANPPPKETEFDPRQHPASLRATPDRSGARNARPRSDRLALRTGRLRGEPQVLPAEGNRMRCSSPRQNKVRQILKTLSVCHSG